MDEAPQCRRLVALAVPTGVPTMLVTECQDPPVIRTKRRADLSSPGINSLEFQRITPRRRSC